MTEFTDEQAAMVMRLRAILELLPPALDRYVAPLGLTSYEYALLETVDRAPGGRLRLSQLASSTNATLPRLSRVTTGLQRKGLIERVPADDDARARDAVVTARGRSVLAEAQPRMNDAVQRTVVEPLEPELLAGFSASLDAILRVLDPDGHLAVTASAR